ncbi:AIPR family protein [Saccharopolyspora sp. NPDC002686]|uniref:AIPR family protein n=1 Tax=Saccharopolyspora sp. NPDC002686 TaxID=3154541 RepID=UPI00331BAF73
MTSALGAFRNRSDLTAFAPNGLLLFALELRFGVDDVATVAATAITDGHRDRKCDLMYVDEDSRIAVLAQGYIAGDETKLEASANKAADLGTAASWVLGNERPDDLGPSLRTAAEELHQAIESAEIDGVELWYVHNLPESRNVEVELERAARSAKAVLKQRYPEVDVDVRSFEVGRGVLDDWYRSTRSPILVTDQLDVPASGWFSESGDGWEAVCTSVPATWLHGLFAEYGDKLFSANVRGYMPRRRSAENINFGIEQTARSHPGRFWAFNNGVTALVHDIEQDQNSRKLGVSGIAVVNGAQTTGSLARVDSEKLKDARVLIRFVRASNNDLVEDVIRYNNSQNQIKPSDFRSGDKHQERLREEFKTVPDATYLGARRGGPEDRARRPSNLISSDTAAQALAAFHQDPGTAYHDLRSIWERDEVYARYFSEHTTAAHIVFCYSLWRSVAEKKAELSAKTVDEQTSDDREALDFLRRRGSLHLLVAAIAGAAEIYLDRALTDTFSLKFRDDVSPAKGNQCWRPLIEALLPFAPYSLGEVLYNGGLRGKELVDNGLRAFRAAVASTKRANAKVFAEFSSHVVHDL